MNLKDARLEWNVGGPLRVSHYDLERADRSLKLSGGACFTQWRTMSDEHRTAWFLKHLVEMWRNGCDYDQVFNELQKITDGVWDPTPLQVRF